jgi:hypothetical protein
LFDPVAQTLKPYVAHALKNPGAHTPETLGRLGVVARKLLASALADDPPDGSLIAVGILGVARTFDTGAIESENLLRRFFASERVAKYGHDEIHLLANELKFLPANARELVRDLYALAFTRDEPSTEAAPMGSSRILALTTTRRQNWEMARYILAQGFKGVAAQDPVLATEIAIRVADAYRGRVLGGSYSRLRKRTVTFKLAGVTARVSSDGSATWDSSARHSGDNELDILEGFSAMLERLASDPTASRVRAQVVKVVGRQNTSAAILRRLLEAIAHHPNAFVDLGRSLTLQRELTGIADIWSGYRKLVISVFPRLSLKNRGQVERDILALPENPKKPEEWSPAQRRASLLRALQPRDLTLDRSRLARRRVMRRPRAAETQAMTTGWVGSSSIEEADLAEMTRAGVSLGDAPQRDLFDLTKALDELAESSPAQQAALGAAVERLVERLDDVDTQNAAAILRERAWRAVARACEAAARGPVLDCAVQPGMALRNASLRASESPDPPVSDGAEETTDILSNFGTRARAAIAIVGLSRGTNCLDERMRAAITRLVRDPVATVRWGVAHWLNALIGDQELFWSTSKEIAARDNNADVIAAMLDAAVRGGRGQIQRLDEVVQLVERSASAKSEKLRSSLAFINMSLAFDGGSIRSRERLDTYLADPASSAIELQQLIHDLRFRLVDGLQPQRNLERDAARHQSQEYFGRIVTSAAAAFHDFGQRLRSDPITDAERVNARGLMSILDGGAMQLRFAAEAGDGPRAVAASELQTYWAEVRPIVDALADVGTANVAHHLVEFLEPLIDVDPRGVWSSLARAVIRAKEGGYQLESLGMSAVVRIVRRYLADHRELLQEDQQAQHELMEILDMFIGVGWPEPHQLAYQLEDLFR